MFRKAFLRFRLPIVLSCPNQEVTKNSSESVQDSSFLQGSIYDWVQTHRLHHAHFATEDDPYDYNKGFVYAHFLTRLRKNSPHQEKLKAAIDMSDLESDSVVMFQKK